MTLIAFSPVDLKGHPLVCSNGGVAKVKSGYLEQLPHFPVLRNFFA